MEIQATVSGFIVVRKPQFSVFAECLNVYKDSVPRIGSVTYGGEERMRWFDIFGAEVDKALTPAIAKVWQGVEAQFINVPMQLCRSLPAAMQLLEFSNRYENRNELIAVRSPNLSQSMEDIQCELGIEWLGYDVVEMQTWSLLLQGLYLHPSNFNASWQQALNSNGLLFSPHSAIALSEEYVKIASENGPVEPLPLNHPNIGAVEVGQVVISTTIDSKTF